jgi:hypothetical protein
MPSIAEHPVPLAVAGSSDGAGDLGRYLHETDAVLLPGQVIVPAAARGHRSRHLDAGVPGYDPALVYLSDSHDSEFGGSHLGVHGEHTYLVVPLGPLGPDPEVEHWKAYYAADRQAFVEQFGAEDDEMWHPSWLGHACSARTTSAARVVRLLPVAERIL